MSLAFIWGRNSKGRPGGDVGVRPGQPGTMSRAKVSFHPKQTASVYDTGIGPQDTLKQDSQGLSPVAAGNPGFRRLLPVTLGSFSGLTLCDPIDGSPPGFPVPGTLQARHTDFQSVPVNLLHPWFLSFGSE